MWDSCMSWLGHNGLWRDLAGALVFWSNNTWPLSALGKQMISLVYYSVFPPFFLCIVFFFFFCSLISNQTPPPRTRDRAGIFGTKSIFYHFYFYWSFLKYCVHMTPLWKSGCTTELLFNHYRYKRPVAARSEWTKRREPATWNCWTVIVGNIPAKFKKPEVWD